MATIKSISFQFLILITLDVIFGLCVTNELKQEFSSCGSKIRDKVKVINSISVGPHQPPQCSFRIFPYSSHVCQLRIDFEMFRMAPPDTYSKPYPHCGRDALIIPAINMEFCGSNSGQHVYVPFNASSSMDSIELLFKIANREFEPTLGYVEWSLKITQLECSRDSVIESIVPFPDYERKLDERIGYQSDNSLLAPFGCLQYYPEPSGIVMSFHYNSGVYSGKMNYAICFRRQTLESKLKLRINDFRMNNGNGNHWEDGHSSGSVDHSCYSQYDTLGRSEDYLLIPEAEFIGGRASKFCGRFAAGNVIISKQPGPLMIQFKSDDIYARGYEIGYHLQYTIE